jgi:hypothetical protein
MMDRKTAVGFLILLLLALPLLLSYFNEVLIDHQKFQNQKDPIVQGKVVSTSTVYLGFMAKRGRVEIEVLPSGDRVYAILMVDSLRVATGQVNFRYSGIAGSEVQLIEETSSYSLLLFLGGLAFLCVVLAVWCITVIRRTGRVQRQSNGN